MGRAKSASAPSFCYLQEFEAVCLADVDGAAPLSIPVMDDSDKAASPAVQLEELERSSVRTWKAVSKHRGLWETIRSVAVKVVKSSVAE